MDEMLQELAGDGTWGGEIVEIGPKEYIFRWDTAGAGHVSVEFVSRLGWEDAYSYISLDRETYQAFVTALAAMAGKVWGEGPSGRNSSAGRFTDGGKPDTMDDESEHSF